MTYAEIMDLEDAASIASKALNEALAKLRKARSNFTPKHAAVNAAQAAYDAAMATLEAAREQMAAEELTAAASIAAAALAAEAAAQPSLF